MKILNCVGGHDVNIYTDCEYNATTRKYTGGKFVTTIPYSGKMLFCKSSTVNFAEPIGDIPTMPAPAWDSVDEIPEDCDYVIVSAMYITACKYLGLDTSKLLTLGSAVVDDSGKVIGCIGLVRN